MKDITVYNPKVSICEKILDTKKIEQTPISAVLERIKNPEQKIIDLQAKFRVTGDAKYKMQLPAFIASGIFRERKSSGFESASGLMVLDLDKFPDAETLQRERKKLIDCPCVMAAFISPSGKGLKGIIKIRYWKDQEEYKRIFMEAEKHFASEYFDKKTCDTARLTFFAHDPDIYINMDAEIFDPEHTLDRDRDTFDKIVVKWMENQNESFIDGNRNNYIFKIAGACCRFGIEKENAFILIEDHITITPDFDLPEVKATINSAYNINEFGVSDDDFDQQERKKANKLFEELQKSRKNPFPIEVFPEKIQNIITDLKDTLNFPVDYTAASIMYAISVSIGRSYQTRFKNEWNEIASFYIAMVGKAGTNKTHPLSFALKPIKKRDTDSFNEYKSKKAEYDRAKTLNKKEREDELLVLAEEEPTWKQFLVSDFTPEALIDVLSNNENGIGVYVDELASWFKNFNRYNNGSEEQFWLSAWSGTPIAVNRKNGKNYNIPDPFLSVIGTIQDGVLNDLASKRTENGFLDRILFVFPDDQEKKAWNENELDIKNAYQWENIVNRVLELNVGERRVLEFNPEAKKYLMGWQKEHTDFLNRPENDNLKTIYAKQEIYAIRFSLLMEMIYYACGEGDLKEISMRSAKAATELVGYFFQTAYKVYSIISGTDPIKNFPLVQQRVFYALPEEFKASEGYVIAVENGMTTRTFQRFIKEEDLFEKVKHAMYRKIM